MGFAKDTSLIVFGNNSSGVLGASKGGLLIKTPLPADLLPPSRSVRELACGRAHIIILNIGGELLSVGDNSYGQLGLGDTQDRREPRPITLAASGVFQVAAGDNHSLVATQSGSVWVFGCNDTGQLGIEEGGLHPSPLMNPHIHEQTSFICCGSNHSLVACDTRPGGGSGGSTVFGFGSNAWGQLGNGSHDNNTFVPVPCTFKGARQGHIVKISAGRLHTLMLNGDGEVFACGRNVSGQLGLGKDMREYAVDTPRRITSVDKLCAERAQEPQDLVVDICCGALHSVFRTRRGRLFMFGNNHFGQLGQGICGPDPLGIFSEPTEVCYDSDRTRLEPIAMISCGSDHTLAVTVKGKVFSWGNGSNYQLGLDRRDTCALPSRVPMQQQRGTRVLAGGDFSVCWMMHGAASSDLVQAILEAELRECRHQLRRSQGAVASLSTLIKSQQDQVKAASEIVQRGADERVRVEQSMIELKRAVVTAGKDVISHMSEMQQSLQDAKSDVELEGGHLVGAREEVQRLQHEMTKREERKLQEDREKEEEKETALSQLQKEKEDLETRLTELQSKLDDAEKRASSAKASSAQQDLLHKQLSSRADTDVVQEQLSSRDITQHAAHGEDVGDAEKSSTRTDQEHGEKGGQDGEREDSSLEGGGRVDWWAGDAEMEVRRRAADLVPEAKVHEPHSGDIHASISTHRSEDVRELASLKAYGALEEGLSKAFKESKENLLSGKKAVTQTSCEEKVEADQKERPDNQDDLGDAEVNKQEKLDDKDESQDHSGNASASKHDGDSAAAQEKIVGEDKVGVSAAEVEAGGYLKKECGATSDSGQDVKGDSATGPSSDVDLKIAGGEPVKQCDEEKEGVEAEGVKLSNAVKAGVEAERVAVKREQIELDRAAAKIQAVQRGRKGREIAAKTLEERRVEKIESRQDNNEKQSNKKEGEYTEDQHGGSAQGSITKHCNDDEAKESFVNKGSFKSQFVELKEPEGADGSSAKDGNCDKDFGSFENKGALKSQFVEVKEPEGAEAGSKEEEHDEVGEESIQEVEEESLLGDSIDDDDDPFRT